jgi:ABC-type bacteriocin/lantibiotic exporter with double-glycine peptidase domain
VLALGLAGALAVPKVLAESGQTARHAPGVLLNVPFSRQRERNSCGAASLAMVMRYWEKQMGQPESPRARQTLIDRTLDPRDRGIANTAMVAYLRQNGFRVFAFSGQWGDLRENLTKGRPLIVGLGPEGRNRPLHYVVVAGIDWQRNFVFVNDPAQRKLFRMTRKRFLQEWQVTGNWTLLAVPKEPA